MRGLWRLSLVVELTWLTVRGQMSEVKVHRSARSPAVDGVKVTAPIRALPFQVRRHWLFLLPVVVVVRGLYG